MSGALNKLQDSFKEELTEKFSDSVSDNLKDTLSDKLKDAVSNKIRGGDQESDKYTSLEGTLTRCN